MGYRATVVWSGAAEAWLEGLSKAKGARMKKAALQSAVRFWQDRHLEGHFTAAAATKYRYKKRSLRTKFAQRGKKLSDPRPLFETGDSFDRATGLPMRVTVRAGVGRGNLSVPWYIKMRPKSRNAPPMGEEMTRIIPREERVIARHIEKVIAELMGKSTKRGKKHIIQ